VTFNQIGAGRSDLRQPIYWRYENFPLGTEREYKVEAGATCCYEGIQLRVTDVAGNTREVTAENGGTGTPMSKGLKWGLIGAAIAVVLILVIVLIFCCRKKYSSVATS